MEYRGVLKYLGSKWNIKRSCLDEFRALHTADDFFTNAVGQEAPTSVSRWRNARFCGVFPFYNIVVRQNTWYNNLGEERRFMYATDNYSKNSDFS